MHSSATRYEHVVMFIGFTHACGLMVDTISVSMKAKVSPVKVVFLARENAERRFGAWRQHQYFVGLEVFQ